MICSRKSNIFDTLSVLELNPNEIKKTVFESVGKRTQVNCICSSSNITVHFDSFCTCTLKIN
jgi:hypothetical protein